MVKFRLLWLMIINWTIKADVITSIIPDIGVAEGRGSLFIHDFGAVENLD